jgi:hypothetical protein
MSTFLSALASIDQRREPLTLGDLWTEEAYATARDALRRELIELKSARRLRVGDQCSLVFESRASVWFQIHEELRFPGGPWERRASELLERYACLVPGRGELRASLFLECTEPELARFLSVTLAQHLGALSLHLPGGRFSAAALEPLGSGIQGVAFVRFVHTGEAAAGEPPSLHWPAPGYVVASLLPTDQAAALEALRATYSASAPRSMVYTPSAQSVMRSLA